MPPPLPPSPERRIKTNKDVSQHHTSKMQLRHNNAKLRRQVVLLDDVIDDAEYMVEIQLEDGTTMVLTVDGFQNWVLQQEEEMMTSF